MSAFAIYALCLTVAFMLYYAFIIVQDLKKAKDKEKTDVETIEVPEPTPDEPPTEVEETEDGRYVIRKNGKAQASGDSASEDNSQQPNATKPAHGDKADDVINHINGQFKPVKIGSDCELTPEQMLASLSNGGLTDAGHQIEFHQQTV
jgi:hypothetical protein